ncbi:hypothetical protein EB796_018527 [Bugula neritina]|uniref:Uncharacterized protein n=1 Tax=Bugula neritina TaxID=10212 RepID=A0A7J7JAV6_BUGNE|nr:hypothetical protein EB796_018527 [Bugula neritina]
MVVPIYLATVDNPDEEVLTYALLDSILVKHKGSITPRLTINDLTDAKHLIMQWVQKESFSDEYYRLSQDRNT